MKRLVITTIAALAAALALLAGAQTASASDGSAGLRHALPEAWCC